MEKELELVITTLGAMVKLEKRLDDPKDPLTEKDCARTLIRMAREALTAIGRA